ncbi:hypothetical protein WJX73_009448 [Symbiochloris irregularis]|uniref:Uncharacterized protein n=1 Tax=Symbiochloris irregularis TaxID=706552 RepID=A0AAW1PZT6_9CHLO
MEAQSFYEPTTDLLIASDGLVATTDCEGSVASDEDTDDEFYDALDCLPEEECLSDCPTGLSNFIHTTVSSVNADLAEASDTPTNLSPLKLPSPQQSSPTRRKKQRHVNENKSPNQKKPQQSPAQAQLLTPPLAHSPSPSPSPTKQKPASPNRLASSPPIAVLEESSGEPSAKTPASNVAKNQSEACVPCEPSQPMQSKTALQPTPCNPLPASGTLKKGIPLTPVRFGRKIVWKVSKSVRSQKAESPLIAEAREPSLPQSGAGAFMKDCSGPSDETPSTTPVPGQLQPAATREVSVHSVARNASITPGFQDPISMMKPQSNLAEHQAASQTSAPVPKPASGHAGGCNRTIPLRVTKLGRKLILKVDKSEARRPVPAARPCHPVTPPHSLLSGATLQPSGECALSAK